MTKRLTSAKVSPAEVKPACTYMERGVTMKKIEFICKRCGKIIAVYEDIYNNEYKGHETCHECRAEIALEKAAKRDKKNP